MKKAFLAVLLIITVSLYGMKRLAEESEQESKRVKPPITVLTSDDKEFELDEEIIKKSVTIQHLLEDLGEGNDFIPLPIVSSKLFTIIVDAWESGQYAEAVQPLSLSDLIELCNAVLYLDSEDLLKASLHELVTRASSQDTINEIFVGLSPYLISQFWVVHPAREWVLDQWLRNYFPFHFKSLEGNLLMFHGSEYIGSWNEDRFWEQVWDLNDNLKPLFQGIDQAKIHDFIITPDKKYIFSVQDDKLIDKDGKSLSVKLLIVSIFNQENILEFSKVLDHQDFTKLLISPDKKYVVTYSKYQGTIKVWSVLDRFKQVGETLQLDSMGGVQLGLSKNYIVSWQKKQNGMIYVWDIDAGVKQIAQLREEAEDVFFGFKDTYLFSFVEDRNPENKAWNVRDGFKLVQGDMSELNNFNQLEFIENFNYIVTGMFEQEQQKPVLIAVEKDGNFKKIAKVNARGVSDAFIVESDDKKLFITVSEEFKEVRVFNIGKNTIHDGILNSIAYTEDAIDAFASLNGRYLIVENNKQIKLFDFNVLGNIKPVVAIDKSEFEQKVKQKVKVEFASDNLVLFPENRHSARVYNLGELYTFINSVDQNFDQIKLFLLAYLNFENLIITNELKQTYNALSDDIKGLFPDDFKNQFIVEGFFNFN